MMIFIFVFFILTLISFKFIFPHFSNLINFALTGLVLIIYLLIGEPNIIDHLNKPAVKNQLVQWRKIRPTVFELQGQAWQLQWELKQNPNQPAKWQELGNILRIQGKLEPAKIALENSQKLLGTNKSRQLQEDYFQCLNQLALRAYDAGEYSLAKKYWLEIKNKTENFEIKKNLDRIILSARLRDAQSDEI